MLPEREAPLVTKQHRRGPAKAVWPGGNAVPGTTAGGCSVVEDKVIGGEKFKELTDQAPGRVVHTCMKSLRTGTGMSHGDSEPGPESSRK